MNIKKTLLFSIIGISISLVGCNKPTLNNEEISYQEALHEKTMTKVQNNVNEIMDKEYDYVLENMGTPFTTTYYVDFEEDYMDIINNFEELENIRDIRVVYPKDTTENINEDSALYINIKDKKVTEVQTYPMSNLHSDKDLINRNTDLVLDQYNQEDGIYLETSFKDKLKSYIEQNIGMLDNVVGDSNPNIDIYDSERSKNIKIYFVNENGNMANSLVVYSKDKKIKNIEIKSNLELIQILKDKNI